MIEDGNIGNVFTIISSSGRVHITSNSLHRIDFTAHPQYNLTISARRRGSACSCSRFYLRVSVLRNRVDFQPPNLQRIYIPEDTALGYDIVTITTTDKWRDIVFSFVHTASNNPFSINARTGLIELSSPLDFETNTEYTLRIKAVSVSTNILGTINQTISVSDVNELPYFVTPCATNIGCSFAIDENRPRRSLIGHVSATDPDGSNSNGTLSYRFQPASTYFSIDSSGGIFTQKILDYEDSNSFTHEFIVSDGCLGCRLSVRTLVTIRVNDLNDNDPVILGPSEISVDENSISGFVVTQYQATDADSSENSLVSFSRSPTGVPFNIDRYQGVLTVNGSIDYEITQEYSIIITARDQGTTPRSTSHSVRVRVGNLNDESPVFNSSSYSVRVTEHSPLNSLVTTVKANDRDSGAFGVVKYSIITGNFDNLLSINVDLGEVRVARDIDREAISTFRLMIQAVDLGRPQPRRATSELQIVVTDTNDNAPIFNPADYSVVLREDVTTNTEIFSVFAVDRDQPGTANSMITYSITMGNVGSVFDIDTSSGAVRLIASLDFEQESSYRLIIVAADGGSSPHSAEATATISVINVNEDPPTLSGNQNISISENQPVRSLVAKFDAEDPDQMNVSFSISSGNEGRKFSIDSSAGTITLEATLDYESTQEYELEIVVTDGMQSTSAILTVNVMDVNEFSPVFISPSMFQVNEEEANGTLVGIVEANDDDGSSINYRVTYSFTQESQITRYFRLDSETGRITTIGILDREELEQLFLPPASTHTVDIVARDQGSPSRQTYTTITIKLVDINDNPPLFTDGTYQTSIRENGQSDLVVFQVSATDPDLGSNSEIRLTFDLLNRSRDDTLLFHDSEDGSILYTSKALDYEEATSHVFNIHATDLGIPPLSNTALGVLNVTDENDNIPIFTNDPYTFNVTEGEDVDSLMLKVKAIDRDTGTNGEVVYSVINSRIRQDTSYSQENQVDEFTFIQINSSTGELQPLTFFDYEREQRVNVTVVAMDKGIPQRSGSATVFFEVVNVDESPPTFVSSCSATVPEDISVNAILTRCAAVDMDSVTAPGNTDAGLEYSIFSGNDDNVFTINLDTGDIILLRQLNRETSSLYSLVVEVQDGAGKSGFQPVKITVSDINDNPPEFSSPTYRFDFSVARIRNHPQDLMIISATDQDEGANAKVMYSISNLITNKLNTVIEINATDGGLPALSTITNLTVTFERECFLQDFSIGETTGIVTANLLCSVETNAETVDVVLGKGGAMSCNALYNGKLTYQWLHNGSLITQPMVDTKGSTDFSYTLSEASFDDAGQYAFKVSNLAGSLQTREIVVEIRGEFPVL